MPRLSTPRIAATFSVMSLPGTYAPGAPNTPTMPGARIGRAADDLQRLAVAGVDGQHLELVRLRMRARPSAPWRS